MIVHTYTFWQIKRYMKDNGYSIRNVTPYKGNRYGRPSVYEVSVIETGEVLGVTTLNVLRRMLRDYDYPIDEE